MNLGNQARAGGQLGLHAHHGPLDDGGSSALNKVVEPDGGASLLTHQPPAPTIHHAHLPGALHLPLGPTVPLRHRRIGRQPRLAKLGGLIQGDRIAEGGEVILQARSATTKQQAKVAGLGPLPLILAHLLNGDVEDQVAGEGVQVHRFPQGGLHQLLIGNGRAAGHRHLHVFHVHHHQLLPVRGKEAIADVALPRHLLEVGTGAGKSSGARRKWGKSGMDAPVSPDVLVEPALDHGAALLRPLVRQQGIHHGVVRQRAHHLLVGGGLARLGVHRLDAQQVQLGEHLPWSVDIEAGGSTTVTLEGLLRTKVVGAIRFPW